ncbi:MAG TPA: thiamine pyrophosphate-dependent enzyme, partial [Candidatus Angelobacter sp.]|nr:thiamine pyrophosphate-dependent enzyme [Candidatus Angelobacter sp.]
ATNNSSTSDFEPDAMALAATQKLPIVCLVEGRFDARAESHILPIPSDSHGVGSGYYPKITVDGCDVVAVFRVAQEAVRRARQGHGPALIECMTARENALVGGAARYIAKDALKFMEQYLRKKKLWSADWRRRIATAFAKELEAAFTQANMPPPGSDFDHVYTPENHGASQPAKSHPPQVTAAPAL